MRIAPSIACGLPFCQEKASEETSLSLFLRITSIVLGMIAVIVGALILRNITAFNQLGTTLGWVAISLGTVLTLLGASLKCTGPSSHENKDSTREYLFLAKKNGRSQEGCRGNISIERADAVQQELQKDAPPGISFDSSIYHKNPGIIGTCTAMSLEFATTYFRLRHEGPDRDPSSKEFLQQLQLLGKDFEKSSEEMRSRQVAFSSITVDPSVNMDVSKSKVIAWINYHDFETDHCTTELDITENQELLQQEIDDLPYGVYFVRMHKPADNHKLEARGHSMIYVHEENISFFYDNNGGLEKVTKNTPLSELLLNVHNEWDIPIVRLYALKSKNSSN